MSPLDQLATPLDAHLSSRWEPGDERSFERIVERYAPLVHARCRRALPGSDADDAVQAVFLVLARRREQAAASPTLAAWLLRVTENVVRNALRDRSRRTRAEERARSASGASMPDEHALTSEDLAELQRHLDAALHRLPSPEREAIQLHYLAGHSLGEVATLSRAGLSTIKERIQRGLARLQAQLLASGCVMPLGNLAIGLPLCTTAVPPALRALLLDLPQQPLSALPPHLRRWSRQGRTMTAISTTLIAGALLVTGLSAGYAQHAANAHRPLPSQARAVTDPTPPVPLPAAQPATLADIDAQLDPERAHAWVTMNWHDGKRTAQRLQALPELLLIPDHGAALLGSIASLRGADLALCSDSMAPHEMMVAQYRLRKETAHLPPQEKLKRMLAFAQENNEQMIKLTRSGTRPQFCADMHAHLHADAPGNPILAWINQKLLPRQVGDATAPSAFTQLFGGSLASNLTGADLSIAGTPLRADEQVPPPPHAFSDADLEVAFTMDPGQGALFDAGSALVQITPEGLHLDLRQMMPADAAAGASPQVDRARLAGIPQDAVLAVELAMSASNTAASGTIQSLLQTMTLGLHAAGPSPSHDRQLQIVNAVIKLLKQVDGQIILYLQPGVMLPAITLEADSPKPAWVDLRTAIGGQMAEDGSITVHLGMLSLTLGWQQGHLVITSLPGGLAAVDGAGGFTTQPDIRKAIAALPAGDPQLLTLLRPAALVSCIASLAGMASPQLATQLPAYQQRLQEQTAYGYLVALPEHGTMHIEASGLMAFLAVGVLAAEMKPPTSSN